MSNNPSSNSNRDYDPNVIIAAAQEKAVLGDWQGGQELFRLALLDWVDDAREMLHSTTTTRTAPSRSDMNMDTESMQEAVATLWLAYAHYLIHAKQFRSATEAYEQAVHCPIAGSVGRIWLDYARFAEDRGKLVTAQQVYIRALVGNSIRRGNHDIDENKNEDSNNDKDKTGAAAVTDGQDRQLLWMEFLQMMQKTKPDLTLDELKNAVQQERVRNAAAGNTSTTTDGTTTTSSSDPSRSQTRFQLLSFDDTNAATDSGAWTLPPSTTTTAAAVPASTTETDLSEPEGAFPVTPEAVEQQAQTLLRQIMVPSFAAGMGGFRPYTATTTPTMGGGTGSGLMLPPDVGHAWMIRDGTDAPQPPEPPLFQPNPPKLSDPTAKDILGVDLAVRLTERLLHPQSGSLLLDVCLALWNLQALHEKQATQALEMFDKVLLKEHERQESTWEGRLAVAGAAADAVRQMNDKERYAFQSTCSQQRQHVLHSIAWEFRHLLCLQQQMLTELDVPTFDGPTVDAAVLDQQAKVCSYLHSAFYLRNRIGEDPHVAMLTTQLKRLQRDQQEQQQQAVAAAASIPASSSVPPYLLPMPTQPLTALPLMAGSGAGLPPYPYGMPPPHLLGPGTHSPLPSHQQQHHHPHPIMMAGNSFVGSGGPPGTLLPPPGGSVVPSMVLPASLPNHPMLPTQQQQQEQGQNPYGGAGPLSYSPYYQ